MLKKRVVRQFFSPNPPGPHTFLHRINTSGVKIRRTLKKIRIFNFIKQWTWTADIAKIIIDFNYFRKTLHRRRLTGFCKDIWFWICQCSEHTKVLNMPAGLNISTGHRKMSGKKSKYVSRTLLMHIYINTHNIGLSFTGFSVYEHFKRQFAYAVFFVFKTVRCVWVKIFFTTNTLFAWGSFLFICILYAKHFICHYTAIRKKCSLKTTKVLLNADGYVLI